MRTFAGYQRIKQYQPMAMAWAVPLTLDPDPDLFGAAATARETAWASALGDGSRVIRVLDGHRRTRPSPGPLDPTLTPCLLPDRRTATGTGDAGAVAAHRHQDQIDSRAAQHGAVGAARHRRRPRGRRCEPARAEGLMQSLVDRAAPSGRGRSAVGPTSPGRPTAPTPRAGETGLRRLFRVPPLAAQVTAASAPRQRPGRPPRRVRPSAAPRGLPLLAYDDSLSRLLGPHHLGPRRGCSAPSSSSPSPCPCSTSCLAPRDAASSSPPPARSTPTRPLPGAFFATAAAIPWLAPTTTDAELAQARRAAPSPRLPR